MSYGGGGGGGWCSLSEMVGRPCLGGALPDEEALAAQGLGPLAPGEAGVPVAATQSHGELAVDAGTVAGAVGDVDLHLGARGDARLATHTDEPFNCAALVLTPVEEVVPHYARHARVRQNVGVALQDLVPRERPVRLRGARVVIVQEGHGARRPETHDARRLALVVLEAPVLRVAHRVLQDALRGEVERLRQATGAVHPVHRALAMRPLVVLKCAMRVAQRVPVLPDGEERVGCFDVAAHKFTAVALGEVEAPAVVAHLMTQVVEPLAQILLHLLVGVIDVGRRREVVAGGAVAGSAKVWVISGDGPLSPRHALAVVAVPGAPAALLRRRPVVDDNVCNCQ
mmetsp:Transcript_2765/g.10084  ORF Transcript_2765/g.10084 Transcript_2765/m.10084 type:complete len:341 (+) Transcript_2765:2293-3315(+)